uniref:DHC_N1 domain-containing protein n=1 Tax=Bursaphelenchus xylophilus TaxID=6326 RepID=A0A1I7SHR4_BURXY
MDVSSLRYPLPVADRELISEFKVEKWKKTISVVKAIAEDLEIVAKFFVEVQLAEMPFSKHLSKTNFFLTCEEISRDE